MRRDSVSDAPVAERVERLAVPPELPAQDREQAFGDEDRLRAE